MLLPEWSSLTCPVIGMLHAPPLPGAADYQGDFASIKRLILRDAETLLDGGVDGLMLENFGDSPFYPHRVPAITVAAMTSLACDIRARFQSPLGINVLRNDGQSALAVAIACGASFIRINVLCGVRVADQGLLLSSAHDLLRDRSYFHANSIRIWADVDVKHSAPLAQRSLKDDVADLIDRGRADAVIVSGTATGQTIDLTTLREIKAAAASTPVVLGSGITAENVDRFALYADGMIVGSGLKKDGSVRNPVELDRVKQLMDAVQKRSMKGRNL